MKGKLLDFSIAENLGLISGDDGNRYAFAGKEWKAKDLPVAGRRVDFQADGANAIGVYLDLPATDSPSRPAPSAGPLDESLLPSIHDAGCPSFYRSADENMLGGVCAGLARKWNLTILPMRILTAFAIVISYGFGLLAYIACWVFLPRCRTRV